VHVNESVQEHCAYHRKQLFCLDVGPVARQSRPMRFMRLLAIERVLVATDLTDTSAAAVVTAARLADTVGAALHLAHVASSEEELDAIPGGRAEYERAIQVAVDAAQPAAQLQTHLLFGEPSQTISSFADRINADVLVLGRRTGDRRVGSDRPVGSTAYACVRRTFVPVLVVAEPMSIPIRHALVAIDASDAARGSLLVAVSWASMLRDHSPPGAALTILHVDTGDEPTDESVQMRRSARHDAEVLERNATGWASVSAERLTIEDPDPVEAIARQASDLGADLVILGTRGATDHGLSVWGSVSAAVTRQLSIPVLLVPPAVWRKHVRDIDPF
jgi:nucleotide-binding universal stress UspA family protein